MTKRRNKTLGISLFPFLAVLICTMGALIVLLLVMIQHARAHAVTDVAKSRAASAELSEQELAALKQRIEDADWRRELLEKQRAEKAGQLSDQRLTLAHLEEHIRSLQDHWKDLHDQAERLQNPDDVRSHAQQAVESELQTLVAQIAQAKRDLQDAKEKVAGRPRSFSLIPYKGPNGTNRRPIYIECTADAVTIQPENFALVVSDFAGPLGPGNPLDACLRALREYLARNPDFTKHGEPYPLLVVRPDGVLSYAAARAAMKSWEDEFGYELIEQETKLTYPPPDATLRALLERTAGDARRRQQLLAQAAPLHYRGTGGGGAGGGGGNGFRGIVDVPDFGEEGNGGGGGGYGGSGGSGGTGGTGYGQRGGGGTGVGGQGGGGTGPYAVNGRGGRGTGGVGNGYGGSGYGQRGGGTGSGGTGNGGQGDGSGGSGDGGTGNVGDDRQYVGGARGSGGAAGNSNSAGPNGGGQTTRSTGGNNTSGGQGTRGANGNTAGGSGARGNGANGGTPSGQAGAPGEQQDDTAYRPGMPKPPRPPSDVNVKPLAHRRGANWGLPNFTDKATGITRPIRVRVEADRMLIVPERGERRAARTVAIGDSMVSATDALVAEVWKEVDGWGIAVSNGYWKPVLKVEVTSGQDELFAELQTLLEGSGLDVERRSP